MNKFQIEHKPRRRVRIAYAIGLISLMLAVTLSVTGGIAMAAPFAATAPGLGAAATFSALGKAGVTNTGNSVLSGKVGADSSITGFPPGKSAGSVLAPAVNGAEADAKTADLALTAQASSAASAGPNLTGVSLVPGVYNVGSALLPGVLTLKGAGVYIFLATGLTASGSVNLTGGATACNVFWHVTGGASITGGSFVGTIIAGTSVTFGNAARLDGRALALTGNVTLINNSISGPSCAASSGATATATTLAATSVPAATKVPATSVPGATAVATSVTGATAVVAATAVTGATAAAVILPVTGADLSGDSALAPSQWAQLSLGFLGLGLILVGFVLLRKRRK